MAGAEGVANVAVVLGALVDILDQHHDGRAGGDLARRALVLEDAGQDLDLIGLLALRGEARLAGPALVEIGLDFGSGQRNVRRAAVDHAADGGAMAFAEGGDAEEMAKVLCDMRPD